MKSDMLKTLANLMDIRDIKLYVDENRIEYERWLKKEEERSKKESEHLNEVIPKRKRISRK